MRRLLIYFLIMAASLAAGARNPGDPIMPLDCHADFVPVPDAVNPMTILFSDQSTGQINHWQWSFGDGATSTLQNPVHTYAQGGTYFVCLTVSNSDTSNLCHDVLCLAVTVHEPGTCIADYIFSADSANPLEARFTDRSTGNINSWHWNFGDGTSSGERNPHHLFPATGKYQVCLTVYHSDSMSICNNTKCDSVLLQPQAECHASFTSRLDSLNREPNTFIFADNSSGDPNRYDWRFDDGSHYSTRNVVHRFHTEGEHDVCLKVLKEVQGTEICSDSLCLKVKTARYFNLGGHLFAGDFPINNPVATGDTGVAYLFRKDGTRLVPYDTTHFTHLGYYAFPNKLNGSYVIRAELTNGSSRAGGYFPTYMEQALKWQDALAAELKDSSDYAVHIRLLPLNAPVPGPGSITGTVTLAGISGPSGELPHAGVILYDGSMNPLTCAETDGAGAFALNGLPYGAYSLYAEVTGKYSRLTPVWLDETRPVAANMNIEVFNYDVTGIPGRQDAQGISGLLFPNPVAGTASLLLRTGVPVRLRYEVLTVTGLAVFAGVADCRAGETTFPLPVAACPPGIYFVSVTASDGERVLMKKLVKL